MNIHDLQIRLAFPRDAAPIALEVTGISRRRETIALTTFAPYPDPNSR